MSLGTIKTLFIVSGLYDLLIGAAFFFFGAQLFDATGVPAPNHWGYLQFGALELMIFGIMFLSISRDPISHRSQIIYGLMLKASYVGMAGFYWTKGECPFLFQPFIIIDAIMFVLFILAYLQLATGLMKVAKS